MTAHIQISALFLVMFMDTWDNNQQTKINSPLQHLPSLEMKKAQPNSIILNGDKYKLITGKFEKDAPVLHLAMNEYGIITGSFVIVLAKLNTITKHDFDKVMKIADNTYRVWPHHNENMTLAYQALLQSNKYQKVEVDIDFSSQSKQQTQ